MNLALGRLLLADAGSCTDDSGDSTLVRGYDCDDDSDHCTLSVPLCGVHTGVAISPARHSLTQKSKKGRVVSDGLTLPRWSMRRRGQTCQHA